MKFKYAALSFMLIIVAMLCACGNDPNTEKISENSTENGTELQKRTEAVKTERPLNLSTFINVYVSDSDGVFSSIDTGHVDISEGINRYKLITQFDTLNKENWEEVTLKVFVVNNGSLVDFSLDGENYAKAHELNARNNEELQREFMIRSEDIKYSHGYISVFCLYNPLMIPKLGSYMLSGGVSYSFEYDCKGGEEYIFAQTEAGEYIDIPTEEVEDAYGIDVAYRQENGKYVLDFAHAYNDVIISADEKLYLKVNLGETVSGNFFLAVICDGEIVRLDGENDCIGFAMDKGRKMFQCEVPTDTAEVGTHYYQLLIVQQNPDSAVEIYEEITYRYRVVIED